MNRSVRSQNKIRKSAKVREKKRLSRDKEIK